MEAANELWMNWPLVPINGRVVNTHERAPSKPAFGLGGDFLILCCRRTGFRATFDVARPLSCPGNSDPNRDHNVRKNRITQGFYYNWADKITRDCPGGGIWNMLAFWFDILHRALDRLFSVMGTTLIGVLVASFGCPFLQSANFGEQKDGSRPSHSFSNTNKVCTCLVIWPVIYSWQVFVTVPKDIRHSADTIGTRSHFLFLLCLTNGNTIRGAFVYFINQTRILFRHHLNTLTPQEGVLIYVDRNT